MQAAPLKQECTIDELRMQTCHLSSDAELHRLLAKAAVAPNGTEEMLEREIPRLSAALGFIEARTWKVQEQIVPVNEECRALQEQLVTLEAAKRCRGEEAVVAFSKVSAAAALDMPEETPVQLLGTDDLAHLKREVRLAGNALKLLTKRCQSMEAELAEDEGTAAVSSAGHDRSNGVSSAHLSDSNESSVSCTPVMKAAPYLRGRAAVEDSLREAAQTAALLGDQLIAEQKRHRHEVTQLHAQLQRLQASSPVAAAAESAACVSSGGEDCMDEDWL